MNDKEDKSKPPKVGDFPIPVAMMIGTEVLIELLVTKGIITKREFDEATDRMLLALKERKRYE